MLKESHDSLIRTNQLLREQLEEKDREFAAQKKIWNEQADALVKQMDTIRSLHR
jgi:FtsZ-binding cell division protein ZapB